MSTIPRLLRRPLPRAPLSTATTKPFTLRSTSTSTPKTLSKPIKFTPPSHPSSLPRSRDPINYPGPPQPPRDPTRRYPNSMPPPDTWMHFFLTSRTLHFYISMGILAGLASFVSVKNFLQTSPFASTVFWDWKHPIDSVKSMVVAFRGHAEDQSRKVKEMRKKNVEDMELRGEYRRAHELEKTGDQGGFGGWGVKKSGREPGQVSSVPIQGVGTPRLRKGDWVSDQIKEVEEEAAKLAEETIKEAIEGEAPPAPAEAQKPEKKGWW